MGSFLFLGHESTQAAASAIANLLNQGSFI
jgi:hypothetical protein